MFSANLLPVGNADEVGGSHTETLPRGAGSTAIAAQKRTGDASPLMFASAGCAWVSGFVSDVSGFSIAPGFNLLSVDRYAASVWCATRPQCLRL